MAAGFLSVLLCSQANAQQSFEQSHESLRGQNPPDTEFTLRLTDPHPYREGELVPIEVAFRAPGQRYQFAGVLLDPAQDCGDLQKPCWGANLLVFSRNDPLLGLGHSQLSISTDLNLHVPRLPAGRYRAALLARRLVLAAKTPDSTVWGSAKPLQYAVSNLVEFEVVPAAIGWVKDAIDGCVAALNSASPGDQGFEARRRAGRRLRFIQHPLAWPVSLDLLGKEENELLAGLVEAPDHRAVCSLMQSRIGSPLQHVSHYYLSRMAWICREAEFPVPPEIGLKTPEAEKTRQEWFRQTRAFESELLDRANATLAASLPARKPDLKGVAMDTLLRRAEHLILNERERPSPEWLPQVRREVLRSFLDLEPARQREFLDSYWAHLRAPEFVPTLENLLERKEHFYTSQETSRILLRRLNDLDPAKAQARLLAMLKAADPRLDRVTLALLPPEAVPPMDSFLIDALAAAQKHTRGDPHVAMSALALYATGEALPRIRAIYESQPEPCQPELMAYFLRVDPDYADRVFRSHPWDMHAPPPACAVQFFERTAPLNMHPVLERYMIAYLMHSDVGVKRAAAISLGRYGASSAQAALWDTLRYFHEYWKDRRAELYSYADSLSFETDLRNALARAKNWRVDEAGLRLIESLCISERCLTETQIDLRNAISRP